MTINYKLFIFVDNEEISEEFTLERRTLVRELNVMHEEGIIRDYLKSEKIKEDMRESAKCRMLLFDTSRAVPNPFPEVDGAVSFIVFRFIENHYRDLLDRVILCNESSKMATFRFVIKVLMEKTL